VPGLDSRVQIDINSPAFLRALFDLGPSELKQVGAALRRLMGMEWKAVYSHTGFKWEALDHIRAPNGAKTHSIRLSRKIRGLAYRDGDFLRFISLHPDHDSAYKR
jgi:hypothetical protein